MRSALITAVMVAVPTGGPIGCLVSPPPPFSQNIQSYEKSPTSHRVQGISPTICLVLGANREVKERVKGKASRIQSSRIGSALACVSRNAQHLELILFESTRFVPNAVCVRVCVCCHPIYSGRQTCRGTSRGHTGGRSHRFLYLPSAVLALIFIARRIQPSLSLVDRDVEFCVPTN